ncbi:MAG TPA: hypothetical protein VGF55_25045 [Gemmataceae bacterium]|jgi:hypothetical protein
MAVTWWQKLRRRVTKVGEQLAGPLFAFDDRGPGVTAWRSAGWWLRAESRPVRAGIAAAAKPVPALLTAWTFPAPPVPEPVEEPLPRGDERIALLREWASACAA